MSQNRRACPACAERYPLQRGIHELPDGTSTFLCDSAKAGLATAYAALAPHWPGITARQGILPGGQSEEDAKNRQLMGPG